jgi:Glucose dehydrogenase
VVGSSPRRSSGTETIYGITNWSVVFAVDARTGRERWRWDPDVNQTAVRPKVCCGVVNRGLALYKNMVIAPIIDGRLDALDADTGKVVWETRVAFPQDDYTLTMAPRIAKGKVISRSQRWRVRRSRILRRLRRHDRTARLAVLVRCRAIRASRSRIRR